MPRVYLGLGSNIGDSNATIVAAFAEISAFLLGSRLSRIWRSRARYVVEQPDFLNAVAGGDAELMPRDLLAAVNRVEANFGRNRSRERSKGPRTLDIDILLYGESIIAEAELIIPHPGLRERKFALLPLLELDSRLIDPISGESYASVLAALPSQGIYLQVQGGYDLLYL